jgi:hypothetical protein
MDRVREQVAPRRFDLMRTVEHMGGDPELNGVPFVKNGGPVLKEKPEGRMRLSVWDGLDVVRPG